MDSEVLKLFQERAELRKNEDALWHDSFSFTPDDVRADNKNICWIKDKDQRMICISPYYEKHLGVTNDQYAGKTDAEMWGASTGKEFKDHDKIAVLQKIGIIVQESWVRHDGQQELGVVLKIFQLIDGIPTTYGRVLGWINEESGTYRPNPAKKKR